MKQYILIALWLSAFTPGMAQISAERSALSNLRKKKWERSHSQLRKALTKDSTSATALYVLALYFYTPENPAEQIDSAHYYQERALADFKRANAKQREKMKKFPLDSVVLQKLYQQIDSTAFEQAKNVNSENAYLHYLKNFPVALHQTQAIELRDAAAYIDALKENTYQSFYTFLQKYPQAHQAEEARKRYDKLLYETKTKDKKLRSYETFLQEYPSTPFRAEVEKNIFEIATASGGALAFDAYIRKYPQSALAKKAKDILYYILLENDPHQELPAYLQNDSLRYIQKLDEGYLVPFLKDGKFGFMDANGNDVIKPYAETLDDDYLCGNITEDVLFVDDQILSRNGKVIYRGILKEVDDPGYGFLRINTGKGITVIHKTGFVIPEFLIEEARLLNGKFIALKKNGRWSLWTLSGRRLTEYAWDDMTSIGDVLVFRRSNKHKLLRADEAGLIADQLPLRNQDFFDEIKPLKDGLIWARTAEFEGVLDQNLASVLPFEKHILTLVDCGITAATAHGRKIYDLKGNVTGIFDNIKCNMHWTAVKQAGSWRLYELTNYHYISGAMDSVGFVGPFALGYEADSVTAFFEGGQSHSFLNTKIEFIPGRDSIFWLMVEEGDRKTIFNSDGQKLFSGSYDKIISLASGIFLVAKREKKGLVGADGKIILPVEYDAIGGLSGQTVSVLKSMKFGLFNVGQKTMIKPGYDKNLSSYSKQLVVAYKEGHYGFIGWDGKPISKFDFDEILYWNDTAALVKKNYEWLLYDIAHQQILLKGIKSYKTVSDFVDEKVLIIQQENNFGVISSTRGDVIPSNFTLIKNVGSAEEPMYFTEKHVEEASIYVVIYYDKNGELLKRQVYEEEDYEKIYCSD